MQTVVPVDSDGDLDLSFKGLTAKMEPPGPPQSARPTIIRMLAEQHKRLGQLSFAEGDHQEMCRRIYDRVRVRDGHVIALALSTDMARIRDALRRGERGEWQDLFREILEGGQEG